MTLTTSEVIICPCGEQFIAPLYSSINVSEEPELQEKLLKGEINKVICPRCRETFFAGRFLLYHDMEKNLMIWMAPKVEGVSQDDNRNVEIERRIQALQKRYV
ncbi:MAG TPA: CpXC domain-containing protein [Nitrospirota bacterium]|nr:CpXC domain-containing protein [Nitrospirota bacterium]